ncbi:hypothetical protein ANN_23187 [Periplaneta americana]|uniref:Uncharacterized protein n=1 Tax=Periplaneta americana TaxID=6978 RepID=A0ABQ8SKF1_PERAM|nr:hypothetical protein ANN_23187 [Periplaneta americana]
MAGLCEGGNEPPGSLKTTATGFTYASNRARGRRDAGTGSICMLKGRGGVLRQRDEGRLRAQLLRAE